jgi:hypothetical protein
MLPAESKHRLARKHHSFWLLQIRPHILEPPPGGSHSQKRIPMLRTRLRWGFHLSNLCGHWRPTPDGELDPVKYR